MQMFSSHIPSCFSSCNLYPAWLRVKNHVIQTSTHTSTSSGSIAEDMSSHLFGSIVRALFIASALVSIILAKAQSLRLRSRSELEPRYHQTRTFFFFFFNLFLDNIHIDMKGLIPTNINKSSHVT